MLNMHGFDSGEICWMSSFLPLVGWCLKFELTMESFSGLGMFWAATRKWFFSWTNTYFPKGILLHFSKWIHDLKYRTFFLTLYIYIDGWLENQEKLENLYLSWVIANLLILNSWQSHAAHILGFKFQYYLRPEVNEPVPDGLYRLTAELVKAEFIDLDNM